MNGNGNKTVTRTVTVKLFIFNTFRNLLPCYRSFATKLTPGNFFEPRTLLSFHGVNVFYYGNSGTTVTNDVTL